MSPLVVAIPAALAAAAAAKWVVVRRPAWAETVSRALFDPRCLVAVGLLLALLWGAAPPVWRPGIAWGIVALALVAGPLLIGILLFPAETRGGRPVAPAPGPSAEAALRERLRAPWDSGSDGRPPAVIDLARAALAAYEPPFDWEATATRLGFDGHVPLAAGSPSGMVMTLGDEAVVAFRGSDDFGDWFANLDLAMDPTGEVHRGFAAAYTSVQDQLRAALRHRGVRQAWITGHSLGGAMAVIAALDLLLGPAVGVRGVMTFGQPLLLAPSFAPEA
ncbi:MAG: lipase family protein, partial [Planctomycetaceae bacterium]